MISCDTCGQRTHERSLVAVNGGFHCPQCAPGLADLEDKIFDMPPAAEGEMRLDDRGFAVVWVAEYDSRHHAFMSLGETQSDAVSALCDGLCAHGKQNGTDAFWWCIDDIRAYRLPLSQCVRDREVIRV